MDDWTADAVLGLAARAGRQAAVAIIALGDDTPVDRVGAQHEVL